MVFRVFWNNLVLFDSSLRLFWSVDVGIWVGTLDSGVFGSKSRFTKFESIFACQSALILLLGCSFSLYVGSCHCVRSLSNTLLSLIHQHSVSWRSLRDHISLSHMLFVSFSVTRCLDFALYSLYHCFVVDLESCVPLLFEWILAPWQVLLTRKVVVSLNKNLN